MEFHLNPYPGDDRVGAVQQAFNARYTQAKQTIDNVKSCVWVARWMYRVTSGQSPSDAAAFAEVDSELCAVLGLTPPFPPVPSRSTVLTGQITAQGAMISTTQFGSMPWWPAAFAWLTPADRAMAAQQLLALGDEIMILERPSGVPLYNESNQFYSPDKFPALSMSDADVAELIIETIGYGFKAVWIFLGGDDGPRGYPIAVSQVQSLAPVLAASSVGNLNQYVLYSPGWDGVFYGYTPQQVASFAAAARAAGAVYVGMEQQTGHIPVGNGSADYEPGGLMDGYDLVLGEFNDGQFDDTVWQILGRMQRPYIRPAAQPPADDPNPPYYLATWPGVYRVFEYYMYGFVRGTLPAVVAASKAQFVAMGAHQVC